MPEQPRVIETTYEGAAGEAFRLKQLGWTGFGRYESIDAAVEAGKAMGKGVENMTLVGSRGAYDLYIKNPNKDKKMFELPKLPGQEEPPKLFPPTLPRTRIPTPFGTVHLPEHKIGLPKLPSFDEKSRAAMKHAIAIDGSMVPGLIPWAGDIIADVVEDLHFAELRKILTPEQYDEFIKQDKISPAIIAMMRALTK